MKRFSTAAALLALLAPPAFSGGAACEKPAPQTDSQTLQSMLKACFPKTEAPEIFLLNAVSRHPNDVTSVLNEFVPYVMNHGKKDEVSSTVRKPDGSPVYVEQSQNAALIPPDNWSVISYIVEPLYYAYDKTMHGGTAPTAPAPPAGAVPTSENPGVPRTSPAVKPAGITERLLLSYPGPTKDPTMTGEAAQLAAARGDYKTAFDRFASIPQGDTPNPAALIGMAGAAYEMGNYPLARRTAAQALELVPDDQTALSLYHLSDGRVPKANLKAAASGFGDDASRQDQSRAGFASAAARAAAAAAAPSPAARAEKSEGEAQAAQIALKLHDPPAAVAHAGKALEFDPGNVQALNYRAIAYGRQGRFAEAERDADSALALQPGNLTAREIRLWARGRQGHWREALSDGDALVAAAPSSAYAHYSRAFALAGLRDKAAALEELRRASELDPAFRGKYDAAVQLPESDDFTLFFGDEFGAVKPVAAPARRTLTPVTIAATVGAALLILLAVALVFYPEKLATLRRAAPKLAFPPVRDALHGRYRLGAQIGAGGMGVVYEGRDLALDRRVALKKIRAENRADARERERFLQEARTVARLKHANIVDIYSIFEEGGDTYLALEFVDGLTLHQLLAAKGPLGYGEALSLFRPMCAAVEHAHAAQIIHRDLKPANVMVTPQGAVKVMDFGVARRVQETAAGAQMTNTVVGTPPYMAPEQEQGTVRRESDVYALAVCFYEMISGRLPFAGTAAGMALNKLNGKVLPALGKSPLPAGFDAAMARALDPDPARRPSSPARLLAEFEALAV